MAGTNPGFDANAFRDNIHFAMQMGAPPEADQQATFHFPSTLVYTGTADAEDVPFDPTTTVTRTTPDPVKVPCAVEYYDSTGQLLDGFGIHQPSRVKVTLLDSDYILVKDADRVVIGGDTYYFRRTEPPSGLFDVGLYVLHFAAEGET